MEINYLIKNQDRSFLVTLVNTIPNSDTNKYNNKNKNIKSFFCQSIPVPVIDTKTKL